MHDDNGKCHSLQLNRQKTGPLSSHAPLSHVDIAEEEEEEEEEEVEELRFD